MRRSVAFLPFPRRLALRRSEYHLKERIAIAADELFRAQAELAVQLVRACGREVELSASKGRADLILIRSDDRLLGPEDYQLEIASTGIRIEAAHPAGAFYALQSLRQLLPPSGGTDRRVLIDLPCLRIDDAPRFPWRGAHLDVSRHFFPPAEVKRFIDLLALHKINHFHWHLTDDQGWRIEIKSFPLLTEKGAWRGEGYGGFYTQKEIAEILSYAGERFVTVVPEIEMPGHAQAALACYPALSCRGTELSVWTSWGVSKEVFCAGNDETFTFLSRILDEVAGLFPGKVVHIGGDECPKERWRECPKCRARIRDEGLRDEHELQSWFVRRIQKHLAGLGKQIVGWDEILEGGLAPGALVMSWRGTAGGIAAARAGHEVVMSPESHCYLDHKQSGNPGEPGPVHFDPPVVTLEQAYSFEPVAPELDPKERRFIIGGQANLWTEAIEDRSRLDYMAFPRLCALAEATWSTAESRDWTSFKERLRLHAERLAALDVNFCRILETL